MGGPRAAQEAVDKAMAEAMGKARGAGSDLSEAARAKSPAAAAARKLLSGLKNHLHSQIELEEWKGDTRRFLPKGLSGIGEGVKELLSALAIALKAILKDKKLPGGKSLAKKFAAAIARLEAEAAKALGALKAARTGLSEQSKEKKAWLRSYRGIALITEGLLTMQGRAGAILPHLSASGGRKPAKPVTAG